MLTRLNMANNGTCSSSLNEQFYMLHVFVENISLFPDKLEKIDPAALAVDVQFIDCPTLHIHQAGFQSTKKERSQEVIRNVSYFTVNFNAGKFYLFPKNPAKLVNAMRSLPLHLDAYKIKSVALCPYEIKKDYLGKAQVPLPGCLCDHVTMANNDINNLPEPYIIRNTFGLLDQELKPAGVIRIFVKLTCLGSYITSQHLLLGQSLLLKKNTSWNEYRCIKIPLIDEDAKRAELEETRACIGNEGTEKSEIESPPNATNVVGLVLVCEEIATRNGNRENIKPVQKDTLQAVENVNDEKYHHVRQICPREKIYRKFHVKRGPSNAIICAGGICMSMRCINK